MLEQYFTRPAILQRHRAGLFGRHLDSFTDYASAAGYPRSTVRRQCFVLRDFGRWLQEQVLTIGDLDDEVAAAYLSARHGSPLVDSTRPAARMIVAHLRELGAIPLPERSSCGEHPVDKLVSEYAAYLRSVRGLAASSVQRQLLHAREFLTRGYAGRRFRPSTLTTAYAVEFVLEMSRRYAPKTTQTIVSTLRSLFRFLVVRGYSKNDLAPGVLTVRAWSTKSPPEVLSKADVCKLLASFDRRTPQGRRGYAMLLLLARLGLRACEVASLELSDINWRTGELKIRGKGARHGSLPLPKDVGEALVAYIRNDRPKCATQRVFIRCRAPFRPIATKGTVNTVVRDAIRRARLKTSTQGPHLLRHTLATHMLHDGVPMHEIGQVLRHRAVNTTEIYARVYPQELRHVVQPWPMCEAVK